MARKRKTTKSAEKAADRHPHFAGVRHAGHDVAAAHHAATNPRPGQHVFSAQEEQAMRDQRAQAGTPDGDADDVAGGPVVADADEDMA